MKRTLALLAIAFFIGCESAPTNTDDSLYPTCYDNTPRTLLTDTIPQLYYDTLTLDEFYRLRTDRADFVAKGIRTTYTVGGPLWGVQRMSNGKIEMRLGGGRLRALVADPSCEAVANSPIASQSRATYDTLVSRYPGLRKATRPLISPKSDSVRITGTGYFRLKELRSISDPNDVTYYYEWEIEPVLHLEFNQR